MGNLDSTSTVLLTMPKALTVWITTNWKILREIGIPDHLTRPLRNLYAGQEATVRTGHENINNLRYADDNALNAESKEELKILLMKVKQESEKVALKLNIQKTKLMVSGPITSWQEDGETVTDFILGGSKITADGDCSHEIKRCLLLRWKLWPT